MSSGRLAENLRALAQAGRPPETPAAIIEWGTYGRQRVILGTLADLAQRSAEAKVESPALVVVGEVAGLRERLKWFEDRPLFGRRVVVTREEARAGELVRLLQERGADVLECPTVRIDVAGAAGGETLGEVSRYDWIVLTSINGIETLFERMIAESQDARHLHGVRLCAISERAAAALRERALTPELVPERYEAAAVADAMERTGGPLRGARVLIPRAEIARVGLLEELRARGAQVDELRAYTTPIPGDAATIVSNLERFAPEYVIFSSGSAARNLHEILGAERTAQLARATVFAAIGPVAARVAEESGMPAAIVPERHRIPDLVEAIAAYDARR